MGERMDVDGQQIELGPDEPLRLRQRIVDQGFKLSTNLAAYQPSDISEGVQNMTRNLVLDKLPEEILYNIHSLLPLRDAARVACVSHVFLHSWRCYSKLTLNWETIGCREKLGSDKEIEIHLIDKVDRILSNHSGIGLKTLKLDLFPCRGISASYLDSWLQTAVKSGIKEVRLALSWLMEKEYNFPCSVLSDETAARSIQSLHLEACTFHPTATLGQLTRLKILKLWDVKLNEEGFRHLLSKSFALEWLEIVYCSEITHLKIPSTLQKLKFLRVGGPEIIQLVDKLEINAPNLSSFSYEGIQTEINVRDSSQLKDVDLSYTRPFGTLSYAYTKLPSIARNAASLTLVSRNEDFKTPVLHVKLLHLRRLEIKLRRSVLASWPNCDFFSLIPYLEAAPVLESFILRVDQGGVGHDSAVDVGDDTLRRKPECRHDRLRQVVITGFCSTKSMVELARHILENTPSLERITLDTTIACRRSKQTWPGIEKCSSTKVLRHISCWRMDTTALAKAQRAVEAANRYILGKVPSAVQYTIVKPCSGCRKALTR